MPKTLDQVKDAINEAATKYKLIQAAAPALPGSTVAGPSATDPAIAEVDAMRRLMEVANQYKPFPGFVSLANPSNTLRFALSLIREVLLEADRAGLNATDNSYHGYVAGIHKAKKLLHEINTYVTNHGLDQIRTNLNEQAEINGKLQALHGLEKDSPAILSSTSQRVFRFLVLGLGFAALAPFLMPLAAVYGAYISYANSNKIAHAQTPSDSPYGTRIHAMEKTNRVSPALTFFAALAEGVTASVFEPLRVIFLYDEWRPENKRAFNQVEAGFFNIVFLPVNLVRGALDTWRQTFTNLVKTWNGEKPYASDGLYGRSVVSVFKNLQKPGWRSRLAAILQFMLLPVDLSIGTIFNALRRYGMEGTTFDRAEKYVYGVAAAVWVGFLSVMTVYPAVMAVVGGISAILVGGVGGGSAASMSSAFFAVWTPAVASWLPAAYTAIGVGLKAGAVAIGKALSVGIPKAAVAVGEGIRAISLKVINSLFANTLAMRLSITGIAAGGLGWFGSRWVNEKAAKSATDNPRIDRFQDAENAKGSADSVQPPAPPVLPTPPAPGPVSTQNSSTTNGFFPSLGRLFGASQEKAPIAPPAQPSTATPPPASPSTSSAATNNNNASSASPTGATSTTSGSGGTAPPPRGKATF